LEEFGIVSASVPSKSKISVLIWFLFVFTPLFTEIYFISSFVFNCRSAGAPFPNDESRKKSKHQADMSLMWTRCFDYFVNQFIFTSIIYKKIDFINILNINQKILSYPLYVFS